MKSPRLFAEMHRPAIVRCARAGVSAPRLTARSARSQDYTCSDTVDPTTGATIPAAELQCEVKPDMVAVARTHATWYGAPAPLFCAPKSLVPEAPRWDVGGWCPSSGTSWDQASHFAPPFGSASRGEIHYGPGDDTSRVPPEVLSNSPSYIDLDPFIDFIAIIIHASNQMMSTKTGTT